MCERSLLRLACCALVVLSASCASGGTRRGGPPPADAGFDPDATVGDGAARDGALVDARGVDGAALDAGLADAGADGSDFDAGHDAGGADAGHDAGLDAGHDAGSDAGHDAGAFVDGGVSVTFPTMAASVCSIIGTCGTLGAGGGGAYFETGDYLQETVTFGAPSISGLRLSFDMDDLTTGCAAGPPPATNSFDVLVNGTRVGGYSFVTGSAAATGRFTVNQSYTFASIAGTGGTQYTIRLIATSTVCPGGSSWNWYPGGTAAGRSP